MWCERTVGSLKESLARVTGSMKGRTTLRREWITWERRKREREELELGWEDAPEEGRERRTHGTLIAIAGRETEIEVRMSIRIDE